MQTLLWNGFNPCAFVVWSLSLSPLISLYLSPTGFAALCMYVIPSQSPTLSSYSTQVLGPDSSVSYTIEPYTISACKPIFVHDNEHVLPLWHAGPSALSVPRCYFDHVSHVLHSWMSTIFFLTHSASLLQLVCFFYSETMICVQADYCLFLNMPPWDFSFFFNCKFPMKSITCVPFSSIRIPYCASSLTLPSVDHHQGFALLFALGFTYCRS